MIKVTVGNGWSTNWISLEWDVACVNCTVDRTCDSDLEIFSKKISSSSVDRAKVGRPSFLISFWTEFVSK